MADTSLTSRNTNITHDIQSQFIAIVIAIHLGSPKYLYSFNKGVKHNIYGVYCSCIVLCEAPCKVQ